MLANSIFTFDHGIKGFIYFWAVVSYNCMSNRRFFPLPFLLCITIKGFIYFWAVMSYNCLSNRFFFPLLSFPCIAPPITTHTSKYHSSLSSKFSVNWCINSLTSCNCLMQPFNIQPSNINISVHLGAWSQQCQLSPSLISPRGCGTRSEVVDICNKQT